MAVCLNPLKSGPTFGFSAYEAPDGTIFMSQSPQIGSYLRLDTTMAITWNGMSLNPLKSGPTFGSGEANNFNP